VGFVTKLRRALFRHIGQLSYTEIDTLGTSSMITRMTSDINQVQTGMNLTLRLLLRSPFIVFGAMIMAFTVDTNAAFTFVVAIPALFIVVFAIMLLSIPLYRKVQQRLDRVLKSTRENLTGVRVIRAFRLEEKEIAEFDKRNEELTSTQIFVGRISALMNPLTYVIINLAIIWLTEEIVSRNYLINEKPDAIIDIVDGANIERNLYLTTQLTEMGIPVVIALNMIDIVRKKGDNIDIKKLSEKFGCEVVETSALKGTGSKEAVSKAIALAKQKAKMTPRHKFSKPVEDSLTEISSCIKDRVSPDLLRWYSIKLFERDQKVLEELSLDDATKARIENIIAKCEKQLDDDSESIITNERYKYIVDAIKDCYVRKKHLPRHNI